MQLADGFPRRGVDALVVIKSPVPPTDHRLGDHDPGIGVAENARVLLEARWVGTDLPQVNVVAGVSRLLQEDAMLRRQTVMHRIQGSPSAPIVDPHTRQDADTLRLDEDLSLLAGM